MMRLFALALALLPAAARAAEPWEAAPFSSDPKALLRAAESVSAPSDAGAIVLFEDIRCSVDENGRLTFDFHRVFRVLTDTGARDWATLEADWAPWHEERPSITARVVLRDGNVHVLDPKTIEETTAREKDPLLHGDRRSLRAPLPAIAKGAVVEERILEREMASALAGGGALRRVWFAHSEPIHRTRLILEAPRDIPLHWIARLLPGLKPTRTEAGGRVRLTFEHGAEAAREEIEEGRPNDLPHSPYVGFSTARSWRDVAAAYERVVDAQLAGADLSSLTSGVTGSREAVARELLARLHRAIRYTGIEFADASIVPRKPADTLARRYGDCKDQAALLVALLRASKIPAHVALLDAGPGLDLDPELPALNAFNHVIVYVPGDHALWIDPTDEYARVGELPISDQGHLALVAASTTTGLIRTPSPAQADNRIVEVREVTLAERGPARIIETTQYGGAVERSVREEYARAERKKLEESLDSYVKSEYRAKKLERWTYGEPADLTRAFELRLEVSGAGRGTAGVSDAAVGIPVWWAWRDLPDGLKPADEDEETPKQDAPKAKPRTVDFVVERPFIYEVRWHIVPAPGFAPRPLPADETLALGPARLIRRASLAAGGTVDVVDRFESGKTRLTPAEVQQMRAALGKLVRQPMRLITFDQVGQAHLAAGRIREALAEFRRLAQLHPKEAIHHAQVARALLSGGLGEAARAQARRAVEIEPTSAWAHITLGWVLQHDAIGRPRRRGWDRTGALAAYRRAKQLDPQDAGLRGDLAHVLELNAEGQRYGAGASLSEAVTEYGSLRKATGSHAYDDDLLLALLWSERWKEARSFAADLPPSALTREARVLTTAALDGADAAIRQANTIADASERQTALKGAASSLLRMRRYELCPPLFLEATVGATDAAQLRQYAESIKRVRRYDYSGDPRDPASLVRRAMAYMMAGDAPDRFAGLFARDAQAELRADLSASEMIKLRSKMRRELQKVVLPLPVMIDLSLSLMQVHASGDDRTGWRVSTEVPGQNLAFYVVREGGAYRIRAASGDDMGREALHRLAANDIAGARQWLDWARQDAKPTGTPDDPISIQPFVRVYRKGSDAGRDVLEIAAATLISQGKRPAQALPVLERCRGRADVEGEACMTALEAVYEKLDRWADGATLAEALAQRHPDSTVAFFMRVETSRALGRWDDVQRMAEERLRRIPDDQIAQRALVTASAGRGDIAGAAKLLRKAIDADHAEAEEFNLAAWCSLFSPDARRERAFEDARRAVELSRRQSAAVLNTLAALYAEAGRVQEAREMVLAAIDATDDEEPQSADWYVLGRIAEQFEVKDTALAAYARVVRRKAELEQISTWKLAQSRIAVLRAIR